MKKVLVACSNNGHDAVVELPYILKKAGLQVTLICSRESRPYVSSHYNQWIEGTDSAHGILLQIVAMLERDAKCFDWIILGDESLLQALNDIDIPPAMKIRIGPVDNPEWLKMLGSKIEAAQFRAAHNISAPSFRTCDSLEATLPAAQEIGFPVMVKIDRSGGGEGVFMCESVADIHCHASRLHGHKLLVEKYIEGALINVETLHLRSGLIHYMYARSELHFGTTGVSMRRRIEPCPEICETLRHIGQVLELTGFSNVSFIRESATGRYYMFELDLRPNAWISYARFAGACFGNAIRQSKTRPDFSVETFHLRTRKKTVAIFYREISYFIGEGHFRELLMKWLFNANGRWRTLPFHDPRFLIFRIRGLVQLFVKLHLKRLIRYGKAIKQTPYAFDAAQPKADEATS